MTFNFQFQRSPNSGKTVEDFSIEENTTLQCQRLLTQFTPEELRVGEAKKFFHTRELVSLEDTGHLVFRHFAYKRCSLTLEIFQRKLKTY